VGKAHEDGLVRLVIDIYSKILYTVGTVGNKEQKMTEFYVQVQDADGTCYGTSDHAGDETIYFEELDEARMFAKAQLDEQFILAQVINYQTGRVVDFFRGES
jgi:hypothetical protein